MRANNELKVLLAGPALAEDKALRKRLSGDYGLAMANLLLLPAAHRIRARVAENFEIQELIMEGVLSLVDNVHPGLIRLRLVAYQRQQNVQTPGSAKPAVNEA